ncbi:MAG: RelA/spoT family protein [Erysipelotrichaceae bacterium]|nr:RelA/spoT family protein [Erysipelotrichaceae bacterium]MCI9311996.1 RelA/spoT family protein [Erysipelotrichaceae bacterium]
MRLQVFNLIDETLDLLDRNDVFYHAAEWEIQQILRNMFQDYSEEVVDFNSRVKSRASLREKIIRNRFYQECTSAEEILAQLSDLIGVTIECRFIEEEHKALMHLRTMMTQKDEQGRYYSSDFPSLHLDVASQQPQIQKNGFAIYRLDGHYIKAGTSINFELQIKSLVHSFWGEIEHKLVYKNTNYYVYDEFMRDLLASINATLTITDRQLSIVYKQMQDLSLSNSGLNEDSFEKQISKAINDLFAKKMVESLGFTLNIKHTATVLGHYIYIKDIHYDGGNNDRIAALFQTFKKLNHIHIDFEHEIIFQEPFTSNDIFIDTLGHYLISIINDDYDWFVFFKMLFAVEPLNDMQDFCLFLSVIKNYLVDNYWLNTSFIKLPLAEGELLHQECARILAKSLCEIGTIHIIYDDKMIAVNHAFVQFVEELEQRVLSYKDFMAYQEAYYEHWLKQVRTIFA